MPVYVDPLRRWGRKGKFRWDESCHMYADNAFELHAMADKIGLRRQWFQDDPRLPHYDLHPARRRKAVKAGAIEHTRREMGEFMKETRLLRELLDGKPAMANNGPMMPLSEPITMESIIRAYARFNSPDMQVRPLTHAEIVQMVMVQHLYEMTNPKPRIFLTDLKGI
jgi:hypothetical protein